MRIIQCSQGHYCLNLSKHSSKLKNTIIKEPWIPEHQFVQQLTRCIYVAYNDKHPKSVWCYWTGVTSAKQGKNNVRIVSNPRINNGGEKRPYTMGAHAGTHTNTHTHKLINISPIIPSSNYHKPYLLTQESMFENRRVINRFEKLQKGNKLLACNRA